MNLDKESDENTSERLTVQQLDEKIQILIECYYKLILHTGCFRILIIYLKFKIKILPKNLKKLKKTTHIRDFMRDSGLDIPMI